MANKRSGKKATGNDDPVVIDCPHKLTVQVRNASGAALSGYEAMFFIHGTNPTDTWSPVPYAKKHPHTNVTSWVALRDQGHTWQYNHRLGEGLVADKEVVFVFKCAPDHPLAAEPATSPDLVPAPVEPDPEPAPRRSRTKKTA